MLSWICHGKKTSVSGTPTARKMKPRSRKTKAEIMDASPRPLRLMRCISSGGNWRGGGWAKTSANRAAGLAGTGLSNSPLGWNMEMIIAQEKVFTNPGRPALSPPSGFVLT